MSDKRNASICLLPGDGIGPEIMAEAVKVLEAIGALEGIAFDFKTHLIGGCAIDETGSPYPDETNEAALASDAVLLASVGGQKWDSAPASSPKPEQGLLALRKAMEAYCNLRPAIVYDALVPASTLKPEVVRGVDLVIVRELTGGIYFGEHLTREDVAEAGIDGGTGPFAHDVMEYSAFEIARIARRAFEIARGRSGRVVSVDKANILDTSKLWRRIVHEVGEREYPDIELSDMLVDNAAMQLVRDPRAFDVILTENSFGDILSDEASMLTGSLGMLASASLGERTPVFEPVHGSAPELAGRGVANPLAQILSAALMLRHALGEERAASRIEAAVRTVLDEGWRTPDIAGSAGEDEGIRIVGTAEMGDLVAGHLG